MLKASQRCVLALILGSATAVAVLNPAAAKTQGSIQISPQKVRIGKQVTLVGKHLLANKFYFLVLSVPNYAHATGRTLISKTPKTNGSGSFRVRFKMPVMALCGKADVAAFHSAKTGVVHAAVTLTGCFRPKKITSPPAPPKKHK